MSRYHAGIVYADGNPLYIGRGKLASVDTRATLYPHPSNARQAIARYVKAHPAGQCAAFVYDAREPERGNLY